MNQLSDISKVPGAQADPILKIAVLAVGGQGGGVLSGWITALAERNGYHAQATSVPGVAQRTGATIYYIELKRIDPARPERRPVFALMPAQGDVDIVVASELVEVGRALLRDLVAPDRTVLIGSSHRDLTISEKQVPGDGRKPPEAIHAAAAALAQTFICFDMMALAKDHGSVVSSSLFGALAGSGALPFPLEAYRAVIEASGRGVKQSLAAFEAAYLRTTTPELEAAETAATAPAAPELTGPAALLRDFAALRRRVQDMPETVRPLALAGLHKVVDFQDVAYGSDYLDRLEQALTGDKSPFAFGAAAAKYIANAMAYDDIIRVADLKTRSSRDARLRRDFATNEAEVLAVTEYFHPRAEEVIGLMPRALGQWFDARPKAQKRLDRLVNRGRRLRTDRIGGFTLLWMLGGLRRWRRGLFRHAQEATHLDRWLALALDVRARDHALGVEVLKCRRLIKGYSDTHARGQSKFDRVLGALDLVTGRDDAADWIRRLREAALQDEEGEALDGAIKTVKSL
ncbi:indolepyruvate oxidoreductase subunit beta family protein [Sulfitobacter sabulilitoris]|uniref:Indolepyruvate oxidoreductase subunit beta family protein n=1 Tax=Sulfitobacter sabulilitoris TaxID=2562655 RepID=A0A5S3P7G9_9RHOB|nr:indolepyruvate oxidoreductase subunit beta family protein [Sulfitobacter sabulilitoris]TMM49308.1 indolepyruvate oxidoreductase subunit beta family protein [Sulfitobacter sabulilitoris]